MSVPQDRATQLDRQTALAEREQRLAQRLDALRDAAVEEVAEGLAAGLPYDELKKRFAARFEAIAAIVDEESFGASEFGRERIQRLLEGSEP